MHLLKEWRSGGGRRNTVVKRLKKRWSRLYKSGWEEITGKASLSGPAWKRGEMVWCSITGHLIVFHEGTQRHTHKHTACGDESEDQALMRERSRGRLKHVCVHWSVVWVVFVPVWIYCSGCGCAPKGFRDFWVTHECSPQSAGSWLSCLSSSRWSWVWAPHWPGTQMMQLPPRCLSGPLGFW